MATLVAVAIVVGCAAPRPGLDFLIVGGQILDGDGATARQGAVGVRDGRIVLVADPDSRSAKQTIDASGLIVAPGFIDAHNHTGGALMDSDRRLNQGFVRQGVTTVVEGPDGSASPVQIRRLQQALDEQGAGTNAAVYVGHNAIRRQVMGETARQAPSAEQMAEMKALVREGMELGAVGFSTGLMYEPGMWSTTDEVVALAAEVAAYGGIYDSHVRDPVKRFVASHQEAIDVGQRAGIPAKLGHLKSVALENEGKIREIIARVEAARAEGRVVVSDQYPYDGAATSTLLPHRASGSSGIVVVPPDLLAGASLDQFDFREALSHPATRARLQHTSENGIDGGFAWLEATGYSAMRITHSEDFPNLVGQYLSQLALERGIEPFDLVAELVLESRQPIFVTLGAIQEWEVQELLLQPWNMIASDGAFLDADSIGGHPRSTGTFPRLLGHYVRELGLLSLEEAVRKITSLPADILGLDDRGRIAEGMAADLVIFDPETIIDRSTWTQPNLFAEGVVHVLVNGVSVLHNGEMTGMSPGRFLARSGR